MAARSAVCACGHAGKSEKPEAYQCGYCYYSAFALGTLKRIEKLQKKIAELEKNRERYLTQALRFRMRHFDVCSISDPYNDDGCKVRGRSGSPMYRGKKP